MSTSSSPEAFDFVENVRLKPVDGLQDTYDTVNKPAKSGNNRDIAYGGIAVAIAIQAAFHTLDQDSAPRAVYSVLGHFLAPITTQRTVRASVERLRDTRTFVTRHVRISQRQDDGTDRLCLFAAVDMIATSKSLKDDSSLLRYSPRDHRPLGNPDDLPNLLEWFQRRSKDGEFTPKALQAFQQIFELHLHHFDYKVNESSALSQTIFGLVPEGLKEPPKDGHAISERVSSGWSRLRRPLSTEYTATADESRPTMQSLRSSLVGFILDGTLAFMPLAHSGVGWNKASAFATLDFALRFHTDQFDMDDWILHETRSLAGGWQRTFNEGRIVAQDGTLIATMTQQCILRAAAPHRM